MADELDILFSTTAPNGNISARQGRICLYNNSGTYSYWINTTGSTTWVEISNQTLWQVDGTETQLKTADEIDMQSKKIINVTDPASAQDASTKNYTDGKISKTTAGEIAAMTEKTTLVDADLFLIEDSTASNAKKKVQRSNIISNLSNVIFSWLGYDALNAAGDAGLYSGVLQKPTAVGITNNLFYMRQGSNNTSYGVVFPVFKWTKIAGVTTLTFHVRSWQRDEGESGGGHGYTIQCDCGGQQGTLVISSTIETPSWRTAITVDVSSLTNGTIYDIVVNTKANDLSYSFDQYISGLIVMGS